MKIGVVGLGLIGGSLAIDLKAKGHYLLGVSRRAETCEYAIAQAMVDEACSDLSLLAAAELVFLCTPIGLLQATAEHLIPHLQSDAMLTDVGSVKTPIVQAIASLWPNFVGGHPMAGTAEQGLQAALPNLFSGKPYILTPTEATPNSVVQAVTAVVQDLSAQLCHCSPEDHDRAVAWISHLPVFVSASLIAACTQEPDPSVLKLAQSLASSGFRDTSRVGGGNPDLGMMMAEYNQVALLSALHRYRHELDRFIAQIEQQDWSALNHALQLTQQQRGPFVSN
jgi:arogenate dehydrogenase (NADP+)